MSSVQVMSPSNKKVLLACGGLTLAVLALTVAVRTQLRSDPEQSVRTQPVGEAMAAQPQAVAGPLNADAPPPGVPHDLPAIAAQQATAAEALKKAPAAARPSAGVITERPDFVSPMEWMMLKGVASQHPQPEQELTRMVNFLRFTKQLEAWESLPAGEEPARRQALANELLADLPTRVRQGELTLDDAQTKMRALVRDAETNDGDRARREAAEAGRLTAAAKK